MIRYFENRDKYGILELAAEYHGDDFDLGTFAGMFDDIVNGNDMVKEYLYSMQVSIWGTPSFIQMIKPLFTISCMLNQNFRNWA